MALFWKTRKRSSRRENEKASSCSNESLRNEEATCIDVNYLTLEPRRVLSADFTLIGSVLDLDDFTQATDENLTIRQTSTNLLSFTLDEGTWSGVDSSAVTGSGTNTLVADTNFLTDISILDNQSIALDVEFRGVDFSGVDSASVVTSGDISQNVFFSMVAPDLNLSGNSIELNHPANDFGSVSLDATTSASLTDINRVEISNANIGDKLEVHSAGVDLSGSLSADQIWFDSSQGLTQSGLSSVTTTDLLLTGQGNFELDSQTNDVSNLAGSVVGDLKVDVLDGLAISRLRCDGQSFCGINATGDLDLFAIEGDITQDANASIFVGGDALFSTANGDVCLDGGDCNGDGINDNIVLGQVSVASSGDVVFAENDDIALGNISGINVRLAGENISLNSEIVASSLLLDASAGVASPGNAINANELLLMGSGNFSLSTATNSIQNIAANINGNLQLQSDSNLTIGALTQVTCGASVALCGLQVSGDFDLALNDTDLSQDTAAIVGGVFTIDTGDGNICLSGGDCDGDGANDNDFDTVNIVSANEVEVADINGLTIGGIQADRAAIISTQSVAGQITIDGNVSVTNQLLVRSSNGIDQVSGSVSTNELLVDGTGLFSLANSANQINFLATDIDGSLDIVAATDLTISDLTYESSCSTLSVAICGLNVTGDVDFFLDNADLNQSSAVVVGGLTTIDVGNGDICLAGGDCDGDGFNDNDFGSVEVFAANDIEIADINNITIADWEFTGDGTIIAGQTDAGTITLDGSIVAGSRLLLQANGGVEQISGSIVADGLLLDGTGDFHLCLENSIGTTNSPGQISANVAGEVYIDNRFAVELVNQEFTTKSGSLISHIEFDVDGNFTIVSDAANVNAIFDSTQINVDGESSFVATGNGGSIALDELNAVGPIGVSTSDGNATIINQHANGIVFRNDDIPGVSASEVCAYFEASLVNGDMFAQATAGDISNEASAVLEVNGQATLIAGSSNTGNITGSNNEFNIELGVETNDNIQIDVLSASANQASIALDRSVSFADTAIGNASSTGADGGTFFLTVDGSVTQAAGVLLSADNVAIDAAEHLFLSDIDADQVAFRAGGSLDTLTIGTTPVDLPDDAEDRFAPRHTSVDSEYGIVVSSQNDLAITTIRDALDHQQTFTGITASGGHAFIETSGDANIHFDGQGNTNTFGTGGTQFGLASDMQNGHVLTALAGGDLTIAENTVLRSTSGAVSDISSFNTDEGVEFENVTKEGPFFSLFLPTPSDDPTTKTVNTDDSQFIGLSFGRTNEQNFIIEVNWADDTLDVLNFDSRIGNRFERISHTFTNKFLTENFELPTFLNFFNDPAINLFDNSGETNLNSATDLNTNDNFVLAFSDSRPQGDLQIASVSRPAEVIRESIIPTSDDQLSSETEVSEFGNTETVADEEVSDAYLVQLDEAGFELKETRQDLEDTSVTQDVIAELKRQVEEGTEYPPGQYRINWTESGVSFSIEFEKGAEEDLDPAELEPVVEALPPSEDLDETEESENAPSELDDAESLPELSQKIYPVHAPLPSLELIEEKPEIEENQPSRAGLIAAGALALGLKRRNAKQNEEFAEELRKLNSGEKTISFLKSARTHRKIGG